MPRGTKTTKSRRKAAVKNEFTKKWRLLDGQCRVGQSHIRDNPLKLLFEEKSRKREDKTKVIKKRIRK